MGNEFSPIPAAACILNPTLAPVLPTLELVPLLHAARNYIVSVVEHIQPTAATAIEDYVGSAALKNANFRHSR